MITTPIYDRVQVWSHNNFVSLTRKHAKMAFKLFLVFMALAAVIEFSGRSSGQGLYCTIHPCKRQVREHNFFHCFSFFFSSYAVNERPVSSLSSTSSTNPLSTGIVLKIATIHMASCYIKDILSQFSLLCTYAKGFHWQVFHCGMQHSPCR